MHLRFGESQTKDGRLSAAYAFDVTTHLAGELTRNRKAEAHGSGLREGRVGRLIRLEDPLSIRRIDSRPVVDHLDGDAVIQLHGLTEMLIPPYRKAFDTRLRSTCLAAPSARTSAGRTSRSIEVEL